MLKPKNRGGRRRLASGGCQPGSRRTARQAAGESEVSVVAGTTRDSVQFWLPEVGASESASSPSEYE